jgi:hypothetical protein
MSTKHLFGFKYVTMWGLSSLLIGCLIFSQPAQADDFEPAAFNPAQCIEYERQLNAILLTRRDEEKVFVGRVVAQIKAGKLPSKLVQTSFQWVRKKRPNTDYPFIYFEKVLRLQAAKLELEEEVPEFDYSIYRSAGQRSQGQMLNVGQQTEIQRLSTMRNGTGSSAGQIR